jgi:hypothetical protein
MAPRFKQLLFQTYDDARGANAFIGFPVDQLEQMLPFRDALRDEFEKITGLAYRININGPYADIDICIRFFEDKDADTVNAFYSKPGPGCFSWLFHTRHYRNYQAEDAKLKPLIKIEISTSHDYPGITIESSVLIGDAIAQLIEKVARTLELRIVRGKFPYPMDPILMSNRSFDAKKEDI